MPRLWHLFITTQHIPPLRDVIIDFFCISVYRNSQYTATNFVNKKYLRCLEDELIQNYSLCLFQMDVKLDLLDYVMNVGGGCSRGGC
jgi:hypothetical protein